MLVKVITYKSRDEPIFMKQNLRFELVLGWLAELESSEIKLKYATVEGSFLMFLQVKQMKK